MCWINAYCANSVGNELIVCNFMEDRNNHDIFSDGFYPDNFPYDDWLKERSILIRTHLEHGGDGWTTKNGWLASGDHCFAQDGVRCGNNETEAGEWQ